MLLTKFFLPELRADRVIRPRLLERLKQAPQCHLVIVSAPAGFGKTSLVSEWVRAERLNTAWVSLDESDNDPVRFWSCLVTAIDKLFPGTGKNAQNILADRQPPTAQILLTTLLNDLTLQTSSSHMESQPAFLVLDDTHLVANAAIYEGLLFFAERLPPYLCLALIGRSDPPLPLGRLRASRHLLEIRAADLRFTLEESEDFLNRVMGFAIPQEQLKQLDERTEGWIAGLQLAGLAMQGLTSGDAGEIDSFIENFSGDDRYILDYLVEEVLNRLPSKARTFLLQTSILDRMCGPLCDAVTGSPEGEGQTLLEQLERENLFLIPLDNRRQWYRYHHLFADLLRHQLDRQGETRAGAAAAELHRRAAYWLAGQGFIAEAIGQALQAQDYANAAMWMETYAWIAIELGEYATLKNWIEALPRAALYARPELLMQYAWTLAYRGEVEQYEKPLAAAEQLWREQGNQARLGEVLNMRADFAATYGDGANAAQLAQQALTLLPDTDEFHRGISWIDLGAAALLQGDMEKAQQAFTTGKALCERSGNTTGARLAAVSLAQVKQVQGNLPQAARLLEEVLAQTGELPIHEGLMARTVLSLIWREWNRLDEAEKALRSVLETVEKTGQIVYFQQCYMNLALILWEKGDLDGMQAAIDQQARMTSQVEGNGGRVFGYALSALQAALTSDLAKARTWKDRNEAILKCPVSFRNEATCLTFIRLSIRLGSEETREALAWLNPLMELARTQQRIQSLGVLWMLKSLALSYLNETDAAVDALEEALKLTYPGGYRRMYLDEGQPMLDLLGLLVRKPSLAPDLRAYAAQLLNCALDSHSLAARDTVQKANLTLIEPLTPREIEVLKLIQAGLSNREIAEKLYLTLNTVKVHVKNIFAKLEVSSRTQAVRSAEDLGLL